MDIRKILGATNILLSVGTFTLQIAHLCSYQNHLTLSMISLTA